MKQTMVLTDNLALVNRAHPCGTEPSGQLLLPVGSSGVLLERRAAVLLEQLMQDIHGWSQIVPVSGWRSAQEQQTLWEQAMREHGEAFTRSFVAAPGCSEHQTGLAIDLGLRQEKIDFIRPEFPYEGICQSFRKAAARYGFIQRYPSGKTHITGIAHEPWHFRYVGVPHAALIARLGLTLEEYLQLLRHRPLRHREGALEFAISYQPEIDLPDALPEQGYFLSNDNCGGMIRTTWKNVETEQ